MPDPVEDILRNVQTSDRLRAAAWDAAYSSDDPDVVAEALRKLPIGDIAREKLWDARFAQPEDAAPDTPANPNQALYDRMQGIGQWAANAIGGAFMGPGGVDAAAHPGWTLASATPFGVGAVARSSIPYIGPAARATASALEHPASGAVIGGVSGYKAGGPQGAVLGALTGATTTPRIVRSLRGVANRVAPPAVATPAAPSAAPRPIDPVAAGMSSGTATAAENAIARGRIAEGMSARPASETPSPAVPDAPPASSPAAPAPSAAPSVPAAASARIAESAPSRPPVQIKELPGETLTRPPAARTPAQMSPAAIQHDLGLASRRLNANLTQPQFQAAEELVGQGLSPAEAVVEVAKRTVPPSAAAPSGSPPAATAPKPAAKVSSRARLTPDEADEYLRLTGKGMSHEEATAALMEQRKLAKKLGTPTPEEVRTRVSRRLAKHNRTSEEQ